MPRDCTTIDHDAIKADPLRWELDTVPPVGHRVNPIQEFTDGRRVELANCGFCGSTLGRRVAVEAPTTDALRKAS